MLALPLVYFGVTSLAVLPRAPEAIGAVMLFACASLAPAILLLANSAWAFRQTRLFAALDARPGLLSTTVVIGLGLAALPAVTTLSSDYGVLSLSYLAGPLGLEVALILVLARSPRAQRVLLGILALLAATSVVATLVALIA